MHKNNVVNIKPLVKLFIMAMVELSWENKNKNNVNFRIGSYNLI